MTFYLIRHGKTEANTRHLYCGRTDLPLSEEGIRELQALHYELPQAKFITSGMKRTDETLHILFGNVAFTVDRRFCEMDLGDFEMKSYEMLKNNPAYLAWISGDNEANVAPGGESGLQMRARALEAFNALEEDTVIVTHGGVIAAIMAYLFPQENKNRYEWQPQNGCGYRIQDGKYQLIPYG